MGNKHIESDFEKEHLRYIIEIIKEQLSDLRLSYNEPINSDNKKLDFKLGYPYHNFERSKLIYEEETTYTR